MRRPSPSLRLVQFCFFIFDFDLDENSKGSAAGAGLWDSSKGRIHLYLRLALSKQFDGYSYLFPIACGKSKSLEVLQGVRAGATFSS